MFSILASRPSCDSNFEEKIADAAKVNQWDCLEESRQWLENVDQTHLVLVGGNATNIGGTDLDVHYLQVHEILVKLTAKFLQDHINLASCTV